MFLKWIIFRMLVKLITELFTYSNLKHYCMSKFREMIFINFYTFATSWIENRSRLVVYFILNNTFQSMNWKLIWLLCVTGVEGSLQEHVTARLIRRSTQALEWEGAWIHCYWNWKDTTFLFNKINKFIVNGINWTSI